MMIETASKIRSWLLWELIAAIIIRHNGESQPFLKGPRGTIFINDSMGSKHVPRVTNTYGMLRFLVRTERRTV